MVTEITEQILEEYKQYYLEHFGHETNLDEGRGSYSGYIDEIIEAINTNTPIPRYPDDLTDIDT
jgi:uncharacterized membrane-anchored protein YitT (DUF2179 family)|tara:strand:- start:28 stop:219 length:192 start_codon:yes stop_codon:yes gene_type:complete